MRMVVSSVLDAVQMADPYGSAICTTAKNLYETMDTVAKRNNKSMEDVLSTDVPFRVRGTVSVTEFNFEQIQDWSV